MVRGGWWVWRFCESKPFLGLCGTNLFVFPTKFREPETKQMTIDTDTDVEEIWSVGSWARNGGGPDHQADSTIQSCGGEPLVDRKTDYAARGSPNPSNHGLRWFPSKVPPP
jgi:hypothetical protein